jgi:hypothetical protein
MADDYNLFDNADSQNTESKNENQDINELLDRAEKQKQDESQDTNFTYRRSFGRQNRTDYFGKTNAR